MTPTYLPPTAQPVARDARIQTLDVIRGFAVLGILLINIMGFAMPFESVPLRAAGLPQGSLDFRSYELMEVVISGTCRALFSMLFGAGMLLFTAKKETFASGYTIADFYYRRLLWLLLFGLLNAYVLLWVGDILYGYALCGLVLFPFRRLKPGQLLLVAGLCLAFAFGKGTWKGLEQGQARAGYLAAVQAEQQKQPLTAGQQAAKAAWQNVEQGTKVDPKAEAEDIAKRRMGYGTVFATLLPLNVWWESAHFYNALWDYLIMMFLGMALFKWGFLSNQWATRSYVLALVLGYGIGLPLGYLAFRSFVAFVHNPGAAFDGGGVPWQAFSHVQRGCVALGHASLLLLVYRSGALPWLMRGLASVGQLAFTNYLMQTIIGTLVFNGYGLGYFDKLAFHECYYLAAAICLFQFVFSVVWLRYFRFGPLEWIWRSLTYWQRQPMRLLAAPAGGRVQP